MPKYLANLLFFIVFSALIGVSANNGVWAQSTDTEEDEEMTAEQCMAIPGGNAPINRLARMQTKMAVRNLEFTYFQKPLFQLTSEDFEKLKKLLPFCQDIPTDIANYKVDKLKELITEAQDARAKTLEWIGTVIADVKKMDSTPENIRQLHIYWTEMQNRQFEMTVSDLHHIADILDTKRQELYEGKGSTQDNMVSPFDPGPPQRTN